MGNRRHLSRHLPLRLPGDRFEPDCPVLGRLVRLKISARTRHRDTDVYRFGPLIFGSCTELGNRSRVSGFFSTCRPGNPTCRTSMTHLHSLLLSYRPSNNGRLDWSGMLGRVVFEAVQWGGGSKAGGLPHLPFPLSLFRLCLCMFSFVYRSWAPA